MNRKIVIYGTIISPIIVILFLSKNIFACSCGGYGSISEDFKLSNEVFIGEVIDVSRKELVPSKETKMPDGMIRVSGGIMGPEIYKIKVKKSFRGKKAKINRILTIKWESCVYRFEKGAKYLIFASFYKGNLSTGVCSNTRPLKKAEEAVKYLDGVINKTPQTFIYGDVYRLVTDKEGKIRSQGLFEHLQVVAKSQSNRYQTNTYQYGRYEMTLAPGEYQVWVERNGQRIGEIKNLLAVDSESKKVWFNVEY